MASRGFTLFELLVVLAILGVLATLAAPRLSSALDGAQLERVTDDLVNALHRARSRAVGQGREIALRLDLNAHRYALEDESTPQRLPVAVSVTLQGLLGETRSDGIGEIRFFPDGSASGGRIVVTKDAETRTLLVDWLTGRIRLLEPS